MNAQLEILKKITEERKRQDKKWGVQNHNNETWLAILTEEVGEVAQEVLRVKFGKRANTNLKKEMTEVAAVIVAWAQSIERGGQEK